MMIAEITEPMVAVILLAALALVALAAVLFTPTFWIFVREFSPLCPIENGSLAVKVGARA